jgi:hypothetical protein
LIRPRVFFADRKRCDRASANAPGRIVAPSAKPAAEQASCLLRGSVPGQADECTVARVSSEMTGWTASSWWWLTAATSGLVVDDLDLDAGRVAPPTPMIAPSSRPVRRPPTS